MVAVNLGTGVYPGADAEIGEAKAGVAILAGQLVYVDSNDRNRLKLWGTAVQGIPADGGVALDSGPTVNQPVKFQRKGELLGCATVVVGESYLASDTAGSVDISTAIATGDTVTFVGVGKTATSMQLNVFPTGIVHA